MNPGRELDILVAEKVMGWKKLTCGQCNNRPWLPAGIPCAYWHNQDGKETAPIFDIWTGGMGDRLEELAWKPSTDIAAAWQAVENIRKRGFPLSLNHQGKDWWEAIFWDETDDRWKGEGSSAPHAICLAALKAVGHEF